MLPYQTLLQKENGNVLIGIGGAGANVLHCFASSSADYVRLYTMSLDERIGRSSGNVEFIQLGEGLSHGLGSGGDPEVGRQAMEESAPKVDKILEDCKLLVMVVGLGGGTGSGAAPVLARMAREAGVFLVSVIMMPFSFEGKRRREQADIAYEEIARLSDIVFCFENDYMEELFRNRSGARAVFEEVDRLLAKATAAVPTMAATPGLINIGLDELASALENRDSRCIFGSGSGYGPKRAVDAARAAIESPLASYHGALRFARTVIVHIAGGDTMSLSEIRQAMEEVRSALGSEEVSIFFGATVKPLLADEMRVTLIASVDAEEFKASFLETEVTTRPEDAPTHTDDTPETPADDAPGSDEADAETEPDTPDTETDEEPEPAPDDESQPETDDEPSETDDTPESDLEPQETEEEDSAEDEEYETDGEEVDEPEPLRPAPAPVRTPEPPRPAPAPVRTPEPPRPAPAPARTPEPQRPAPAPTRAPEPQRPAPAPARTPEPQRPAPAPARNPEPQRPARPVLQQLDLFANPMRQGDLMTGNAPLRRDTPSLRDSVSPRYSDYGPDASRRRENLTTADLDIPPSMREDAFKDIFPDT